jgi:hypothetical protein
VKVKPVITMVTVTAITTFIPIAIYLETAEANLSVSTVCNTPSQQNYKCGLIYPLPPIMIVREHLIDLLP